MLHNSNAGLEKMVLPQKTMVILPNVDSNATYSKPALELGSGSF